MEKIQNILDKYVLNRLVFKIILVIFAFFTTIPYIHMKYGGYFKIILLYGVVIIIYEMLRGKYRFILKDKMNIILLLFCISYLITIINNRSLNMISNLKALIYMFVFFVLLYMTTEIKNISKLEKEIEIFSKIVIIGTFICSVICLITYIFSISGCYMTNSGLEYYGMYENRLWGIYNANVGATLNCISIIISFGFIMNKKRNRIAIFYMFNVLLQYICLVLTGSRATLYTLLVIAIVISAVIYIKNTSEKRSLKKIIVTGFIIVVVAVGFLGLKSITQNVMSYVPAIAKTIGIELSSDEGLLENPETESNQIEKTNPKTESNQIEKTNSETEINQMDNANVETAESQIEKTNLERMEKLENRDGGVLTGRTILWKASLGAFAEKPIWGTTRENLYEEAKEYVEIDKWSQYLKASPHNIYICVLVSSGIVGFVLMAIFVIMLFSKSLYLLVNNKNINIWIIVSFLIIIMFLINEFVEARILYQVNIFYILFWSYCGFSGNFLHMMKKSNLDNLENVKGIRNYE